MYIWNWRKNIVIKGVEKSVKDFAKEYNITCKELKNFLTINSIEYKIYDSKKSKKSKKKYQ